MQLKTLALIAMVLTTSNVFAAPLTTLVDDITGNAMMSGSPNNSNIGSANDMIASNNTIATPKTDDTTSTSEDMSADTATGDDDY